MSVLVGDDTIGNSGKSRKTRTQSSAHTSAGSECTLVAPIPEPNLMWSAASDCVSDCIHHASHAVDE